MTDSNTVIYGLDEEYHNVDISEVKGPATAGAAGSGGAGDLYIMPTQETPAQIESTSLTLGTHSPLEFIDSTSGDGGEVTGSVDPTPQFPQSSELGSLKHRHPPGATASFLESKGFGWLLEVEEDEEEQKPLL